MTVAVGYVRLGSDRIEKDPDLRIQEALDLAFRKFSEVQSVRQTLLWLRQEKIALPTIDYGPEGRRIVWKLPVYNTIYHLLTNPIYAGAYAFGRTGSRIAIEGGRKKISRGVHLDPSDWEVLIRDRHEGYIDWAGYERNQRLIRDNANGKSWMSRGAVRRGEALLAGLFRCGHCGRKLHVAYTGKHGSSARYHCQGAMINHGAGRCIGFGAMRVDREVSTHVIERLQPLGMGAALAAIEARGREEIDKRRQVELALEQARYEAARVRRQYDAVDPDNRLVAGELERRWNGRLKIVASLQEEYDALLSVPIASVDPIERQRLLDLGTDVERAWTSPGATPETKKRIIRMLIEEIMVRVADDALDLKIHWVGGDHTDLCVRRNQNGQHRWSTDADTVELVRALARQLPDKLIAASLNRAGKKTVRVHA